MGMLTWLANAVTFSRLFFFAGFVWELAHGHPFFAIVLFVFAWGLDAIDGPIARLFGQVTTFGSQLDKAIDRIIIIGSVVFLIRYQYVPAMAVFLLVKDIGLSVALSAKPATKPFVGSGHLGKILSVLQGLGIIWLFFRLPGQSIVVGIIALLGGYVAVRYLRKI